MGFILLRKTSPLSLPVTSFSSFLKEKNKFVGLRVGFLPGLLSDRLGYSRDTDLAPFFPSERESLFTFI